MRKIISLFKRDYEGTRLVYDEVVEGAEWVTEGEGIATIKFDGTACMIWNHMLYKRYDRKLKRGSKFKLKIENASFVLEDFKSEPEGWFSCDDLPDFNTGHWPGWLSVGDGPEDRWHREGHADANDLSMTEIGRILRDGTYELVGPKVRGNPYHLDSHTLWKHGSFTLSACPRTYEELKKYFRERDYLEGIVWHHLDDRMVKIKRRDFGYDWPFIPKA